jgi:hypothetical protein
MLTFFVWTGAMGLGYFCVHGLNIQLQDVLRNAAAPLPAVTGAFLLYRNYEDIVQRTTYIGLLFYWYITNAHGRLGPLNIFTTLLTELMRWSGGDDEPIDEFGRHWMLNIAETFSLLAVGIVFENYWADRFWTMKLLSVFLTLLVFGNGIFQLWMQKQITRLTRWNRHAWTWRDLIIEHSLQSIIRKLDSPSSRAIMRIWWSACFWFYRIMTSKRIYQVGQSLFFMQLVYRHRLYNYCIRWLVLYTFWLRELMKFSNPDPPPYQYETLKKPDHIRVLLLHPTFGFRPISCNLVQGPHMRLIFYEAISYTWGGNKLTQQIMVDGCTMKVTESVYEILSSYSSLFIPKLLWIDALCIDQKNNEEKSLQVSLMQGIYQNALFTTVFLGRASTTQQRAFNNDAIVMPYRYDGIYAPDEATKDHNENARAVFDLFNEFHILKRGALRHSAQTVYKWYEMLRPTKSKPRQWNALLRLLQHPWFARIWVVQEVALSQRVFVKYGDETIEWDILAEALGMLHRSRNFRLWLEWTHKVQLRHIQNTSLYNAIRIDKLRKSLHPHGEHDQVSWPTLPQLLNESFYFKATNPRDHIFGLMSLCQEPLDIDYNQSIDETFINAAKVLLRQGSVDILFHAGGVGNKPRVLTGLPTWVPDWRDAPQYERLCDSSKVILQKAPVEITLKDDRTLSMTAVYIDSIAELGPIIFDSSAVNGGMLKEMHQIATRWYASLDLVASSPYIADDDTYAHDTPGQSLVEAVHRALLCGKQSFGWQESLENYWKRLAEWESRLLQFNQLPDDDTGKVRDRIYRLLESMVDITEEVERCCGGRRLFVTEKGYIGLCPPHSRKGDGLHLVHGLHASILLRRVHMGPLGIGDAYDPNSKYELVGETYCHGVTNRKTGYGEARGRQIEVI